MATGRAGPDPSPRLQRGTTCQLGEHVAPGEDQEVLPVDGDLGAAVLRIDDGVAHGDVEGMMSPEFSARRPGPTARISPCWGFSLAVSGMTSRTPWSPRTRRPDDDPVIERVELHRKGLLGIH